MFRMNQKAKLLLAVVAFLLLTPLTIYYVLDGAGVFDTRSRADAPTKLPEKYRIADLNADNEIGVSDFDIWLSNFKQFKKDSGAFNAMADLNEDEAVTISDFILWLKLWREYKIEFGSRMTWWFDDDSTVCTMTERFGTDKSYMVNNMQEFLTEAECIAALANREDDEPVVAGVDSMVVGYGTGADGDCLLAMGSVDINSASCTGRATADAVNFSLTTSVAKDSTTVTLASAPAGLAVGDEILFINLQGTVSDYSHVGEYESVLIEGIEGNTITLQTPLKYGYDGTTQKVMVQRVPQYNTVNVKEGSTLSPKAWDGTKGGVLIFKVKGNLVVDGKIHADGMGYRGGAANLGGEAFGGYNSGASGKKGNLGGGGGGSAGSAHSSYPGGIGSETGGAGGAGGNGSSGDGTYNSLRGAAGGGAGYGTGGQGGAGNERGVAGGVNVSGKGGVALHASGRGTGGGGGAGGAYGLADISRLYFGSGGGGGGRGSGTPGAGGAGGGIIYIRAKSVEITGNITSNGQDGKKGSLNSDSRNGSGGGGGGAGGSIKFLSTDISIGTALVTATGGNGGSGRFTGGTGGVGRIGIYYSNTLTGTTSPVAYTKK